MLILTVGLPRSGKSTWAKQQGLPIVNRDAIRLALHGQRFLREAESMVTALENYMVRALFLAGHPKVIVDATNITAHRRKRWESDCWEVEIKIFPVGAETCIARAKADGDLDIIPHIERMVSQTDIREIIDGG